MEVKPWVKSLLSVLVIIGGGFALFNLAFIIAAAIMWLTGIFTGLEGPRHVVGIIMLILLVLSWFVFKSRLSNLLKATFLTMPLMTILVSLGLLLYEQPQWITYVIGAILIVMVLIYLYTKKLQWHYYVSTLYVGILALIIMITGMEI